MVVEGHPCCTHDACCDKSSNFRLKCFLNDEAPQPKIVGKKKKKDYSIFFVMVLVLYTL